LVGQLTFSEGFSTCWSFCCSESSQLKIARQQDKKKDPRNNKAFEIEMESWINLLCMLTWAVECYSAPELSIVFRGLACRLLIWPWSKLVWYAR